MLCSRDVQDNAYCKAFLHMTVYKELRLHSQPAITKSVCSPEMEGVRARPKAGKNAPAANGRAMML